jgi:membrane protein implicated in regulation of membrane protease activity
MLGVAGLTGYMTLLFAAIALWWALANVMDQGWAALIVAAIWAAIGVVLYVVGRRRLRQIHPTPQRTAETVKELPGTLKESVRRKA